MVPIDYRKWDALDEYSSDEDGTRASPQHSALSNSSSKEKAVLITIPWDPYCEIARWALDRHAVPYEERSYPFLLHLHATLPHSDAIPHPQQLHVPIVITSKDEVLKRSVTDILMYLFAHSFSGRVRVYGLTESLTMQQKYDEILGPAVTRVFLRTCLGAAALTERYLWETVHLNTWKTAQAVLWPALRLVMWRWYGLHKHSPEEDWKVVDEVFESVRVELAKDGGRPYIAGATFTAADISFASHAALVLFPNERDDTFAGGLGVTMPSLGELPEDVAGRARALRATAAGRHAIKMWRKERVPKERPEGYRTRPSKFSAENNPWWATDHQRLRGNIYGGAGSLFVICVFQLAILPRHVSAAIALLFAIALVALYAVFVRSTLFHTQCKQAWFGLYGRHVPTEKDVLDKASKDKRGNEMDIAKSEMLVKADSQATVFDT
ncbi:hypothetical protein HK101_000419 [Irineochytrium annulatum]|nr:hypothetical protein HK101_000419 [Irineochytrium annulatum]